MITNHLLALLFERQAKQFATIGAVFLDCFVRRHYVSEDAGIGPSRYPLQVSSYQTFFLWSPPMDQTLNVVFTGV
jgi:hypothetical protein